MFSLVIADDEDIVRLGLKNNIKWAKYGFLVVGDASGGLMAEDIIKKELPDLLITDIKMPDIDGIELIKRVKRIKPNIEVIILSAYDTFEYARTAILYDVAGYLLKPIDEDELDVMMSKVIKLLSAGTAVNVVQHVEDDIIQKVRLYINENYAQKITLEELSKEFYINSSYLSSAFKNKIGIALVDYVAEVRIKKAKELLENSNLRVRDVALEVGYDDYTYFCKVFKKNVATTPLEYRFAHR